MVLLRLSNVKGPPGVVPMSPFCPHFLEPKRCKGVLVGSKGIEKTGDRDQLVDRMRRILRPYKSLRPNSELQKTLGGTLFKPQDTGQITGKEFCFIIAPGHQYSGVKSDGGN